MLNAWDMLRTSTVWLPVEMPSPTLLNTFCRTELAVLPMPADIKLSATVPLLSSNDVVCTVSV